MPATISGEQTYTIKETAVLIGRAYLTILRHIDNGKLHAVKAGRDYVITRSDLQAYLDRYVNVTLP